MCFVLAEIGHADVVQVALADHVMGGNGIAEKHVCLIESHCIDCVLVGRVGRDECLGVQGLDLVQRQVVIQHAQTQTGQTFAQ